MKIYHLNGKFLFLMALNVKILDLKLYKFFEEHGVCFAKVLV